MPRIRRWFHVSHDINSDGEVWELTDKFGVTGLRLWLELLSIADRNEGALPLMSDSTVRQLSIKCNTSQTRVRVVYDFTVTKLWVVCDPTPRLRNYAEYNPTRDAKKLPIASPPNPPNPPSSLHKNEEKIRIVPKGDFPLEETNQKLTPEKLVELYNRLTPDECPAVAILSPARRAKAKQYLAAFPKQEFWEHVFERVHQSKFLRGLSKATAGPGNFRFDFDWMLTKGKDGSENCLKVQEGKYADDRR